MAAARAGQCCGVPAPTPGTAGSSAWDGMSEWYTSNVSPATTALAQSLHLHLGLAAEAPAAAHGLDVLEMHCADARAAALLLPAPGVVASYTACDFSAVMVEAARARLGGRARVEVGDSMELPFEAASFDRYMSNMGCCCVSDLDAKLREARRVLRPGGVAAMSMRVEEGPGDTSFALVSQALRPFGYPPGPTREGVQLGKDLPKLREKMRKAGFEDVVAWNAWVTLPVHDVDSFMSFSLGQPGTGKFLDALDEPRREEAKRALREAGRLALEVGAIQIAVAAVVAKVGK